MKKRIKPSTKAHLQSAFASIALLFWTAAACSMLTGALLAFSRPDAPLKASHPAAAGLTLAERVTYQRAIEVVYWRHRIWPKENAKPKPPLDEVMSTQQIEKKVEDYLRDSQALEAHWQKPIAAEQLQAEMERMARDTKQPEALRELFEALGNDPFVIAECLARPVLAERLLTQAEGGSSSPLRDGKFNHEAIKNFRPSALAAIVRGPADPPRTLTEAQHGAATYTLPEIDPCIDDTWTPTSTTNAPEGREAPTAVWTGSEMIVWGGAGDSGDLNTGGRYNPSTDSWTATSTTNAPSARGGHAAVWTGSEMIVWSGFDQVGNFFNTGGRYNPSTDSWTATSHHQCARCASLSHGSVGLAVR